MAINRANSISINPRNSPIVAESAITIMVRRVATCLVGHETLRSSEKTSPKNLKIEKPADPETPGPDELRAGVRANFNPYLFSRNTWALRHTGQNFLSSIRSGVLRLFFSVL
jgi:hypothetical protein